MATAVQSAVQEKVAAGPDGRTSVRGPGSISHVSISQLNWPASLEYQQR